ncbi:TPA: hypothetical protein G8V61_000604 [Salmonella enterica]|nr:hypothetical protein [Salmonella enterica]
MNIQAKSALSVTLLCKATTNKLRIFKEIKVFIKLILELFLLRDSSDLRAHQKDVKIDKYQLRLEQTADL